MDTVMIRSGKVVSLLGKPITSSHGTITGYNGVTTTATGDATYRDWETDRKSTRLNSSHRSLSRMPSSA